MVYNDINKTLTEEEKLIIEIIIATRKTQEYLWGECNPDWDIEEWKRMFRKRIFKIDNIDSDDPHAKIELKKRLLQNACLSIALINIIDKKGIPSNECDIPSNLESYK